MSEQRFTLEDLRRVLREAAGADDGPDDGVVFGGDVQDVEFTDLGYDSLALLETVSRIEREYGISLGDAVIGEATTPRALVRAVNEQSQDEP
ncbi:acyl carrier protein [Streptomyces olivaceoviridis]|uniref:Acyl carrier protein n=1 Tax=Streptomyces olivaceoviridis TaxID=1921 RepID=A0ABW7VFQ1_STROI|nr:acyl carrier protein [Streptomyces corchorusii]